MTEQNWPKIRPIVRNPLKKIALFEEFFKIFALLQGIALFEHYFCLKSSPYFEKLPYLRSFFLIFTLLRGIAVFEHIFSLK